MPDHQLISVKTNVVMQVLIPSLYEAAAERATGEGEAWLESMGWHAREIELERFAPARQPMSWLAERLETEGADAVVASLVAEEPDGRPEPSSAPSWRVPGPGGHVRHFLAIRAAAEVDGSKSTWLTGFFGHCVSEA